MTFFQQICLTSRTVLALLSFTFLGACANYEFRFNDREIYRPPTLFTAFEVADPDLQRCLDQTIKDQKITLPTQLRQLKCTHSGIESLSGLQQFPEIRQLKLNANQIRDISPLLELSELRFVDLSLNPELDCGTVYPLEQSTTVEVVAPDHCQK